ncbi:hypothetical protein KVR01_009489 [Diaporthe batatas]|uniref:uncharacterized protein n=1 Tax=Diaporthe batatas TaxID=748121 RepID=UPI001D03BA59|nr:uncharacterized protein KVR01_009489 [Diaporthe batatas]KAG8161225.1 hypothetical protein KVR01_009489 [Diaporthe batatas]
MAAISKDPDSLVCCKEAADGVPADQIIRDEKTTTTHSGPSPPCPPLHSHPRLCAAVDTLPVIRLGKTKSTFAPARQARLRNSLSPVVGLLELANAGDFAANVWNEVPVPTHAVVLMAVGGVFALAMSAFAFRDARASWPNVCLLLEQRRRLRGERAERLKEQEEGGRGDESRVRGIDVLIDVVWRELGTEAISRFGLDLLLGGGAVMIGVGTLMAIGGADRKVWLASNLLSGYVGNAPLAMYALVNCAWSCYICARAGQHWAAASAALKQRGNKKQQEEGGRGPDEHLGGHPAVWAAVRRRARSLQLYTAIVGVASILGGAGSLMTATMWYGYVILTPVVVSSVLCNVWWRRGLGYDRPLFGDGDGENLDMSAASLTAEMEYVARAQDAFRRDPTAAAGELGADLGSLESVLGFIVANDLFEDLCLRLLGDRELAPRLFPVQGESFTIKAAGLLEAARGENEGRVLGAATKCLQEDGLRSLRSRERYLAEALMNYLYMSRLAA